MAHPVHEEVVLGTVAIVLAWALALYVLSVAPRRPMNRLLALLLYFEGATQWIAWNNTELGPTAERIAGFFIAPALWALPIIYLFLLARLDTRATSFLRRRITRRILFAVLLATEAVLVPVAIYIIVVGHEPAWAIPLRILPLLGFLLIGVVSVYALVAAILAWRRATDRVQRAEAGAFALAFGARDLLFGVGILITLVDPLVLRAGLDPVSLLDRWRWALPILATIVFIPLLTFGLLRSGVLGVDVRRAERMGQGSLLFLFMILSVLGTSAALLWIAPHFGPLPAIIVTGALLVLLFLAYRWMELRVGPASALAAPRPVAEEPRVGLRLFGRYRILHELGRGAQATAWLAEDLTLGRTVVIKSLDARRHDPYPEAQRLASVRDPHVVQVYDLIRTQDTVHLVLEHVPGGTLKARLAQGPVAEPDARRYGSMLLDAIAAVHRAGLVHRDVKPGNIFLTLENQIRLGDFGVARPTSSDETLLPGFVRPAVGTVPYMSPEQAGGRKVSPASDLYSAGLVLFEVLAGEAYWAAGAGESGEELRRRIARRETREQALERVPPPLRGFFTRALEPEPEERYSDANTMKEAWLAAWPETDSGASPVQEEQARPTHLDQIP